MVIKIIINKKGVKEMEKKEYLNEEEYQKNNIKVKKIGKTLLIVGVIVLVIGILLIIFGGMVFGNTAINGIGNMNNDSFNTTGMQETTGGIFGSFGLFAIGGFINTIGFGLIIVGGIIMFVAHRREITAYTVQQVMPVAQEGIEKMTPTIGNAAGEIAKGITSGIKKGLK